MVYTICTGQLENGTQEQQAAFIQLFGVENVQYKFDFYFHWYNIAHEYGHCLCDFYQSEIVGLQQEFLVNRFAVSLWRYVGYEMELERLQTMLNEVLRGMKNPVPAGMSFEAYYEQIWGTEQIIEVAIYGYLQFKSVWMALESREELADVLREMGVHKEIHPISFPHKEYAVSAETAKEVLHDLRRLLDGLGVEQPAADIELMDDPAVQGIKL